MSLDDKQQEQARRAILAGMLKKAVDGDVRAAQWVEQHLSAQDASEPSTSTVRDELMTVATRVPGSIVAELDKRAASQGCTRSRYICDVLRAHVMGGAVLDEVADGGDYDAGW